MTTASFTQADMSTTTQRALLGRLWVSSALVAGLSTAILWNANPGGDPTRRVGDLHGLGSIDRPLRLPSRRGDIADDRPFVAGCRAGHESLAESSGRRDHRRGPIPADRIGGQDHACRRGGHHALDDDRHLPVRGGPVGGGTGCVGAGQDPLGRRGHLVSRHVEDTLVHAGERALRAIFQDAAGSDGEWAAAEVREAGPKNAIALIGWHPCGGDRERHTVGNVRPGRDELAEPSGLAADLGGIGHPNVAKAPNFSRGHRFRAGVAASIAARRIQSTSSAISSAESSRCSRHIRMDADWVRTTSSRVIRSRSACWSFGSIASATWRMRS